MEFKDNIQDWDNLSKKSRHHSVTRARQQIPNERSKSSNKERNILLKKNIRTNII